MWETVFFVRGREVVAVAIDGGQDHLHVADFPLAMTPILPEHCIEKLDAHLHQGVALAHAALDHEVPTKPKSLESRKGRNPILILVPALDPVSVVPLVNPPVVLLVADPYAQHDIRVKCREGQRSDHT